MARRREERRPRRMKKIFLVLCEGATEEAYVNFLRSRFRVPIKIVPKIAGGDVSQRKIEQYQKEMRISASEAITTFLMYDMDVPAVVQRLQGLDAHLILSNPCLELWFLLHSMEIHGELSTAEYLHRLMESDAVWKNYKKPVLSVRQQEQLWNNRRNACARARGLSLYANPSSNMFEFIESLEKNIEA